MDSQELKRLKARRQAKAERDKLRQDVYTGLKARMNATRAAEISKDYKKRVKAKRPLPTPATAEQVTDLERKITRMQAIKPEVPDVRIPEPKVVVERAEPDSVLRERMGQVVTANREIARSVQDLTELLRDRDGEIEVEITGRDKKGNIKTIQVKRI